MTTIGQKALKPNPALEPLAKLVGVWETVGSHPYLPGKVLHGQASYEWTEGGAFLLMHTQVDDPQIPDGVAIFGSDDGTGEFFMIYFDERDVSRKYDITTSGDTITGSRLSPELSQRMVYTIAADGKTMTSKGEMSRDGGAWEPDLELTYTHAK